MNKLYQELLIKINRTERAISVLGSIKLIDVHQQNGILVTTSRNIAEVFEKRHSDVLRDIRNVLDSLPDKKFGERNFALSSYVTEQNKENPEYLLTRDGTMLLIMGYTGEKALSLKTAYIERFNEMELLLTTAKIKEIPIFEEIQTASLILEKAGIQGNQLALSLDKAYKARTGDSILALTGIILVADTQHQLYNPTELGRELGISAIKFNKALEALGYQEKIEKKWEMTVLGQAKGGIYLDTNKKHSDGTPVRQLKWPYEVIKDVQDVLDEIE